MLITNTGIIIQLRADDVSRLGRITMGVKLMNLEEGVKIVKMAKVREKISDGEQEIDDQEIDAPIDNVTVEVKDEAAEELQTESETGSDGENGD